MLPINEITQVCIQKFHEVVSILSYNDPLLKPAVSLFIMGALGYLLRNFIIKYPRMTLSFIRNRFVMSITIIDDNSDDARAYVRFMKFYEKHRPKNGSRRFKLKVSYTPNVHYTLSADQGKHWFMYNRRYYWIVVKEMESNGSEKVKSKLTIYTYGLTAKPIEELVRVLNPSSKQCRWLSQFDGERWGCMNTLTDIGFDDVIIDPELKKKLIDKLDWFINNKKWYNDRHLDYKLHIMLEGPPGTGKTFLSKVIAGYLKRGIAPLNVSWPDDKFESAAHEGNNGNIFLIEDFDSAATLLSRERVADLQENDFKVRTSDGVSLTCFLNMLQGVGTANGTVFVSSTNHLELVDPAIYRPQRCDLVVHVDALSHELIIDYIAKMYDREFANQVKHIFIPAKASELTGIFIDHPFDGEGFVNELIRRQSENSRQLALVG